MTQLFMGFKPGVGPVVKVMKNNDDDPLTTPNTAFAKYLFNSESQHLGYVYDTRKYTFLHANLWSGQLYFWGEPVTSARMITYTYQAWSAQANAASVTRLDRLYPDRPFIPLCERRVGYGKNRWLAGRRHLFLAVDTVSNELGYVRSYQFESVIARVTEFQANASSYNYPPNVFYSAFQPHIAIGDWVVTDQSRAVGAGSDGLPILDGFWNLPADATPLPSYVSAPGLETLALSSSRFELARPGYSLQDPANIQNRIIDSNRAPALVVMAGRETAIPSGGSRAVPAPSYLSLTETAVVDVMVKETGGEQFIPVHVRSGYVRKSSILVTYEVFPDQIVFYNDGSSSVDVTYMVFNADDRPPSTGGQLVMFRGDDGEQEYIQIKKPGTSDPASRPGDILLDTRFPTIQIIKEGWLPLSAFTVIGGADSIQLGQRKAAIPYDSAGLLPFVKFSIVFPDYIRSPDLSLYYRYPPAQWGPPSNQSGVCQLTDNAANFFLSPGNWSRVTLEGVYSDRPDPLGIRYYILGIPQMETP